MGCVEAGIDLAVHERTRHMGKAHSAQLQCTPDGLAHRHARHDHRNRTAAHRLLPGDAEELDTRARVQPQPASSRKGRRESQFVNGLPSCGGNGTANGLPTVSTDRTAAALTLRHSGHAGGRTKCGTFTSAEPTRATCLGTRYLLGYPSRSATRQCSRSARPTRAHSTATALDALDGLCAVA